MTKLRIRAALSSDVGLLAEIDRACFREDIAFGEIEFAHYVTAPCAVTWIAEHDGGPFGFAIAAFERLHRAATLITLDVLPGYRRARIGSTLLSACEVSLAKQGISELDLQVDTSNAPALAFYAHHGFARRRLLRNYYGIGTDAYLMQKTLEGDQTNSGLSF